jgi:hypothetical protein
VRVLMTNPLGALNCSADRSACRRACRCYSGGSTVTTTTATCGASSFVSRIAKTPRLGAAGLLGEQSQPRMDSKVWIQNSEQVSTAHGLTVEATHIGGADGVLRGARPIGLSSLNGLMLELGRRLAS